MPNLAKSDLLVLDFWNTRCGVCFKKLPLFASIRDRWNSKYPVSFSLVNVPYLNEDDVEIVERIRTFDTTFTLQIMRDPIYAQQIGIEGFPTVIAVRPSGEIVYFGSVDQLESFLEDFYH
jgi:thiol-disulfide isomerase/thioredoxin